MFIIIILLYIYYYTLLTCWTFYIIDGAHNPNNRDEQIHSSNASYYYYYYYAPWPASKMVLSTYAKQRILGLSEQGHKAPTIARLLREEGIKVSRVAVYKFLKKYRTTKTILGSRSPCS